MTYTYNPITDIGRVRRTIPDKDEDDAFWTDEDIQTFLDDEGDWRRATALAVETMANDSAFVNQVMRVNDLHTDGASVARAMLSRAALLRQQALDAEANVDGGFDIIEQIVDDFSYRERFGKEILRHRI